MPREFSRNQRLANEVLRTLNEVLHGESKDPRLKLVSLNALELSRDLSVARVHYSLLDPNADAAPVGAGLKRAAGFLRSRLGQEMKIRHVPELRFFHDNSAAEAQRISDLIEDARGSEQPRDSEQ